MPPLLSTLVVTLADDDGDVRLAAWKALEALCATIDREDQPQ